MTGLLDKIQNFYDGFIDNAIVQAEKGNKAAGARARKASLSVEKLLKEFRKKSVSL